MHQHENTTKRYGIECIHHMKTKTTRKSFLLMRPTTNTLNNSKNWIANLLGLLESLALVFYYLPTTSKALIAIVKETLSNKLKTDPFRVIELTWKGKGRTKSHIIWSG